MPHIVLHQFPRGPGRLPSASPFCMKLEAYLRMAGLEHEVKIILNPAKGPAGKAPFIELDGERLPDSRLIILRLERDLGGRVDGWLTDAQRAEAVAWQRLMEEHLYWIIVYSRWLDPDGYPAWSREMGRTVGVPRALSAALMAMFKRRVARDLRGHGFKGLGRESVYGLAAADLAALAAKLGDGPYLFGDRPTSFDAMLAAHIGSIVEMPWDYGLKTAATAQARLIDHYRRMMTACFPDFTG